MMQLTFAQKVDRRPMLGARTSPSALSAKRELVFALIFLQTFRSVPSQYADEDVRAPSIKRRVLTVLRFSESLG